MKLRKSIVYPACLLVYLAVMAWIGRDNLAYGRYGYYYGIVGTTLACIIALYFFLRRKERLAAERERDMRPPDKK